MREIKFRAWVEEPGTDIRWFYYFKIGETVPPSLSVVAWEQFTGLHDKNGKEIYQNDICKIKFDVNKVDDHIYNSLTKKEIETGERVFLVESPMFNNQPELNADVIDIIGNIHENPELLND